jgi:hypothetical protein
MALVRTLESARPLAKGFECRVRLPDGALDEAVITQEEAGAAPAPETKTPLANADQLRLLIESARIRLAYARPSLEQMRLVCQALAGPALEGGELADISAGAEQSALGKLLANWSAVMEGKAVATDRQKGQARFLGAKNRCTWMRIKIRPTHPS